MEPKSRSASTVIMTQIILPYHANVAGNMHGGEVMKLMDSAAGVAAARHSLCNVVTASVTQLSFIEPIFVGDLVLCKAQLTYAGNTSMEIYVTVDAEDLNRGIVKHVCEGYFFMVALDRNGRPTGIPPLLIESEEEQRCLDSARDRIQRMKETKSQSQNC